MINGKTFARKVLSAAFPDMDTPSPWDVDAEYVSWAYIWGEFGEYGLVCNTDGSYTVGEDSGDVDYFGGLVEALQHAKRKYIDAEEV